MKQSLKEVAAQNRGASANLAPAAQQTVALKDDVKNAQWARIGLIGHCKPSTTKRSPGFGERSVRISDQHKQQVKRIKETAASQVKSLAAIAFYLWVLFSLFEVHRFVVLREVHQTSIPGYKVGQAAINALVLAKIILIGQDLHLGERFSETRLIYSALFKSAVFALLLACFDIVEDVILGVIHGRSIVASIPQLGGGGLEGKLIVTLMAFVTLVPFFMFIELQRVLGKDKLRAVIFHNKSKADAA